VSLIVSTSCFLYLLFFPSCLPLSPSHLLFVLSFVCSLLHTHTHTHSPPIYHPIILTIHHILLLLKPVVILPSFHFSIFYSSSILSVVVHRIIRIISGSDCLSVRLKVRCRTHMQTCAHTLHTTFTLYPAHTHTHSFFNKLLFSTLFLLLTLLSCHPFSFSLLIYWFRFNLM
jgi:hypothetical protein